MILSLVPFVAIAAASLLSRSTLPMLCKQYETYNTTDGRYNVSTNQWGYDGSGEQCLQIEEDDSLKANTTSFSVTWTWEDSPEKVHSYPNVNLNSPLLPIPLQNVSACNIDAVWSIAPGSEPEKGTNGDGLNKAGAITNVALDFFLDPDRVRAKSTTKPKYEIMIWFTAFGGVKPIGYVDREDVPSLELDGIIFKLYTGPNDNGQYVYSWLADMNVTDFRGDVSPLVHYLWRSSTLDPKAYIGIMQFGTETFHVKTGDQVTFDVKRVQMDVEYGTPKPSSAPRSASSFFGHGVLSALCLGVVALILFM